MPRPEPNLTPRFADAYPNLIKPVAPVEPPETLSEITGAIHGLTDYIKAMDARTAAVEKAVHTRPTPTRSTAAEATRATAFRMAGTVAIVALLCAALVVGLYLYLDLQGLADTAWVGR